jgi:hypothetical protein
MRKDETRVERRRWRGSVARVLPRPDAVCVPHAVFEWVQGVAGGLMEEDPGSVAPDVRCRCDGDGILLTAQAARQLTSGWTVLSVLCTACNVDMPQALEAAHGREEEASTELKLALWTAVANVMRSALGLSIPDARRDLLLCGSASEATKLLCNLQRQIEPNAQLRFKTVHKSLALPPLKAPLVRKPNAIPRLPPLTATDGTALVRQQHQLWEWHETFLRWHRMQQAQIDRQEQEIRALRSLLAKSP